MSASKSRRVLARYVIEAYRATTLRKGVSMETHGYTITFDGEMYRLYIPATGEIRECKTLLPLLRSIVHDFGSDERIRKG
jgi:hypothetical protein